MEQYIADHQRKMKLERYIIDFLEEQIRVASKKWELGYEASEQHILSHFSDKGFSHKEISEALKSLEKEDYIIRIVHGYHTKTEDDIHFGLSEYLEFLGLRVCEECGRDNVVTDYYSGEIVCSRCGLVLGNRFLIVDYRRVNPPRMNPMYIDNLPSEFLRNKSRNLRRRLYEALYSSEESHFRQDILPELQLICDQQQIPLHIRRDALLIYKQAFQQGLLQKGNSRKLFAVASLVLACKFYLRPLRLETLEKYSYKKGEVLKSCRKLMKSQKRKYPILGPSYHIKQIAYGLRVDSKHRELLYSKSLALLHTISKKRRATVSGKSPRVIAAAIVYIATLSLNIRMSQKKLSELAGVRVESLNRTYRRILRRLGTDLLPYERKTAFVHDSVQGAQN